MFGRVLVQIQQQVSTTSTIELGGLLELVARRRSSCLSPPLGRLLHSSGCIDSVATSCQSELIPEPVLDIPESARETEVLWDEGLKWRA